jgi:hypothetical protein
VWSLAFAFAASAIDMVADPASAVASQISRAPQMASPFCRALRLPSAG